jgi:protein-disulfide isomerase
MNQARNISTAGRRALLLALSGILLFAFAWMLAGHTEEAMAASQPGSAAPASGSERAAVVEGEAITFSEVEASAAERLEQLEMQRLQMEHRLSQQRQQMLLDTLSEVVEERLVALEARAEGLTPEELLEQRVQVAPVTDEEIEAFYQELVQQRPQGVPPKERIEGQIRSHLQEARQTEARESFFGQLREKYAVEVFLQEPRVEVAADGFPSKGPADAPVTIVEFSDFQCSFCARVVPTLNRVLETYGDKVRLVYRNFPLTGMHTHAQKAAEASLCAREQGKFWEMHDLVFANQHQLSDADLYRFAEQIGLNLAKFKASYEAKRGEKLVDADRSHGEKIGIQGTPAVYVNGRLYNELLFGGSLTGWIDDALKR